MYSSIDLSDIEKTASEYILSVDRSIFIPYFSAAEQFIHDTNALLGGSVGLDLLLGNKLNIDSFSWDIYFESKEPYNYAKKFADALADIASKSKLNHYIVLNTSIKNTEFSISIDTRMLFKLVALSPYRNVSLIKLLNAPTVKSYFNGINILVAPEDAQLIDMLQLLYNPGKCDDWPKLLENEQFIYEKYKLRTGGADHNRQYSSVAESLLVYIRESKSILIGSYAIDALRIDAELSDRVQFITHQDISEVTDGISKILGKSCKYIRFNVNLMTDFRLIKHTIYIDGKSQIPICDVFNSSSYELIPTWGEHNIAYNDILIGNPYVIQRFLYIDIWILKLIAGVSMSNMNKKIQEIYQCVSAIRSYISKVFKTDPKNLFQIDNYVGVYIDPIIAKKNLIKDIGYRAKPYYPQFVKNEHLVSNS